MANLILASKREVKSGSQMWHAYRLSENTKSEEFYFASALKCLKYCFLLRKRAGGIIPKAIYNKLMADVQASKAQAEPSAPQESAPEAEQASEPSAVEQFQQLKAKHPDAVLLFRKGDFYVSYFADAITLSEVLGITQLGRSGSEQAMFPAANLDTFLPRLVRAGKRVAICDDITAPQAKSESAPKKATRKSAKKESK